MKHIISLRITVEVDDTEEITLPTGKEVAQQLVQDYTDGVGVEPKVEVLSEVTE
jgi:hypothetical protein